MVFVLFASWTGFVCITYSPKEYSSSRSSDSLCSRIIVHLQFWSKYTRRYSKMLIMLIARVAQVRLTRQSRKLYTHHFPSSVSLRSNSPSTFHRPHQRLRSRKSTSTRRLCRLLRWRRVAGLHYRLCSLVLWLPCWNSHVHTWWDRRILYSCWRNRKFFISLPLLSSRPCADGNRGGWWVEIGNRSYHQSWFLRERFLHRSKLEIICAWSRESLSPWECGEDIG